MSTETRKYQPFLRNTKNITEITKYMKIGPIKVQ